MSGRPVQEAVFGSSRLDGLLSVDWSSQLRKVLTYSYSAPGQYLVEIVRWLISIKVESIQITSTKNSVEIVVPELDIPVDQLDMLLRLTSSESAWEQRQAALDGLQSMRGLGPGSMFGSGPTAVRLDAVAGGQIQTLEFKGVQVAAIRPGSERGRILIERSGNVGAELEAVASACPWARVPVQHNGRQVSTGRWPASGLVGVHFSDSETSGLVWIPREGELCRIHLLDKGVRFKLVATPGRRSGMVFEAAVEAPKASKAVVRSAEVAAYRSYGKLAKKSVTAGPEDLERLEWLLFTQARSESSTQMMLEAPLFPVADGSDRATLAELTQSHALGQLYWTSDTRRLKKASHLLNVLPSRSTSKGGVAATRTVPGPASSDSETLTAPGKAPDAEEAQGSQQPLVLVLTPRQRDFLHWAGITPKPLPLPTGNPLTQALANWWKSRGPKHNDLADAEETPLADAALTPDQRRLLNVLSEAYESGAWHLHAPGLHALGPTPVFVPGRGNPRLERTADGNCRLALPADSPTIKKAVLAAAKGAPGHLLAAWLEPAGK